jgi:trigger factor
MPSQGTAMKFKLTIPHQEIQKNYQAVLKETASRTSLPGFRKGKAPLTAVEKEVDKAKLYEQVLKNLLPGIYTNYITSHHLKPITDPKISITSAKENEDWEIDVEIAEKPEVKLNQYQDAIKSVKAKDSIWTPGKPLKPSSDTDASKSDDAESQRLTQIFDVLLRTCTLDLPELLIEEEVNRSLSRLLNQIDKLGLNLDQYLHSLNTTLDKLKAEYRTTAEANLKLEFILAAIAAEQKLTATQKDIDAFIKEVTDPKVRQQITDHPENQASLAYSLTKRKVVDYLMAL